MTYRRPEEYGFIGNLETATLVGRDRSIDWCPIPHVESPSVFAQILDDERGDHFDIRPTTSFESIQDFAPSMPPSSENEGDADDRVECVGETDGRKQVPSAEPSALT